MSSIHDPLRIHHHDIRPRREAGTTASPNALPRFARSIPPDSDFQELVDEFKLELVYRALAQAGGNHRRAAALIGVHRSSFTRMLHRLEGSLGTRYAPEDIGSTPPMIGANAPSGANGA